VRPVDIGTGMLRIAVPDNGAVTTRACAYTNSGALCHEKITYTEVNSDGHAMSLVYTGWAKKSKPTYIVYT